jgi:hypothetical protein
MERRALERRASGWPDDGTATAAGGCARRRWASLAAWTPSMGSSTRQGGTQSPSPNQSPISAPRTYEPDWLWTPESESTESPIGFGPRSPSPRASPIGCGPRQEPESTGESDRVWTQDSEFTGESDRVWTQESESMEEPDLASHLLRLDSLGRALIGPLRERVLF